jgi:hypothetical protein
MDLTTKKDVLNTVGERKFSDPMQQRNIHQMGGLEQIYHRLGEQVRGGWRRRASGLELRNTNKEITRASSRGGLLRAASVLSTTIYHRSKE